MFSPPMSASGPADRACRSSSDSVCTLRTPKALRPHSSSASTHPHTSGRIRPPPQPPHTSFADGRDDGGGEEAFISHPSRHCGACLKARSPRRCAPRARAPPRVPPPPGGFLATLPLGRSLWRSCPREASYAGRWPSWNLSPPPPPRRYALSRLVARHRPPWKPAARRGTCACADACCLLLWGGRDLARSGYR